MIILKKSLTHWGSDEFYHVFKDELGSLGAKELIPQHAVSAGRLIMDSSVDIVLLNKNENEFSLIIKVGFLFSEILGGYCCGEEEPIVNNAYSEVVVVINKETSVANLEFICALS